MSKCFTIGVTILLVSWVMGIRPAYAQKSIQVKGLKEPVEIRTDRWGIAHIYAQNEEDLFFAQGYNAAQDRLFQFELWRRQATGTVAEILGARELNRDIGTRLFLFRGDMEQEMNYYHPRGTSIIQSFVKGVNAYIEEARTHPENLPLEFQLLDIQPEKWTPEVVISRHQGLLGNITRELNIARLVSTLGPETTQELLNFHPNKPTLEIDSQLEPEDFSSQILDLYNAFRRPVRFQPQDLAVQHRNDPQSYENLARLTNEAWEQQDELNDIGSNNWVLDGSRTQSGYPIMSNDPHRSQAAPSLRYMTHLVAPGWNVIGGGEPEIPGISIGHNEYGAWGLTVYRTDAEDLYVYDLNPQNLNEYQYASGWEAMRIIQDTILVKDQDAVAVELRYTRHGPVVHIDSARNKAYAVRCGWREIGGSPYLASLRMDQAQTWEEFREACNYSHIPGENMIWADREGNIGWQAVGIQPIRPNWDGLMPVPGDGRYEWAGYLPIKAKPHAVNPDIGFLATANQNVTPKDFPYPNALGFEWSDPYRGDRIHEVLASGRKHTMLDMMQLQTDVLSIPARNLVPLLMELPLDDPNLNSARAYLKGWDFRLEASSVAAGLYVAWERILVRKVSQKLIPEAGLGMGIRIPMWVTMRALETPHLDLGPDPLAARETLLRDSWTEAIAELTRKLGKDISQWQYGQENYKHILIRHPLSAAVSSRNSSKTGSGACTPGGI